MREYLTEEEWKNLTPDLVVKAILKIDHDLEELISRKRELENEIAEIRKRLIDLTSQLKNLEGDIKTIRQQKATFKLLYYSV